MEKQRSAPPAPDLPVGLYVQNTIEELTKELRPVGPIGDSKSRLRFSVASVIKRGSEVSASQGTKPSAQTSPELTNSVRSIKVVLVDKYDSSRRFLLEQMLVKSEEIPSEQDGFELWASYQTLSRQNLLLVVQRWLKNITTSLLVLFNNSSLSSWLLNPLSNEETECASELKKRFNLDLEISTISASEGSEEDQLDKRLDYVFEARHSIKRCTITLKMAQLKNYSSIREQLKYEMLEQTSRRTSSQGGSSGRPRLLSENYLTELAHMSGEGAVETRKNNLQESPDDSNTSLELSWSNRSLSRPFVLQEALCEDLGRRKRSIGNYCGTDKQAFEKGLFLGEIKEREDHDEPNSLDGTKFKLERKFSAVLHRRGHYPSKTLGLASIGDELLKSGHDTKHDMKMDEDEHTAAILTAIESARRMLPKTVNTLTRKDSLDHLSTKLSSESSTYGPDPLSTPTDGDWRRSTNTTFLILLREPRMYKPLVTPEESASQLASKNQEPTLGDWLESHLLAHKTQNQAK